MAQTILLLLQPLTVQDLATAVVSVYRHVSYVWSCVFMFEGAAFPSVSALCS